MIHVGSWKRWNFSLAQREPKLQQIVDQMKAMLHLPDDDRARWISEVIRCLDLLWARLEIAYKNAAPEMACQRSGRCCHKQVPRVSLMEIAEIAKKVARLPLETQATVINQCQNSIKANYNDPLLGTGVPCPMLVRDEKSPDKYACAVHPARPYICRASGVTGQLSWDCPLWQIHKTHFPTLSDEWVDPFLDLFGWCRAEYSIRVLHDDKFNQMALLGAGVLGVMNLAVPIAAQAVATALVGHHRNVAPQLWKRDVGVPKPIDLMFMSVESPTTR